MTIVNNWGHWIDSEIPTYGAVSMNSVEWIDDEIASGVDLSYLEALEVYLNEMRSAWLEKRGDIADPYIDAITSIPSDELLEQWTMKFGDLYDDCGESEYLIGDWVEDDNGKYAPDTNGEYAAIALCGSNIVIVEWSKFVTRCALCSPCYPNSGDLDTAGQFLTYDLPMDLYGEYRENDNAQFVYIAPSDNEEAHSSIVSDGQ